MSSDKIWWACAGRVLDEYGGVLGDTLLTEDVLAHTAEHAALSYATCAGEEGRAPDGALLEVRVLPLRPVPELALFRVRINHVWRATREAQPLAPPAR